jgi:Putative beta-barrel porin 2
VRILFEPSANMTVKKLKNRIAFAVAVSASASLCSTAGLADGIYDFKDALDTAMAPQLDEKAAAQRTDRLDLYLANDIAYDDNLYRLPGNVDLTNLPGIGSNPSRGDYIDSVTAGLDSEWLLGNRQSVDLDLRADDNQYFRNTNLNNVSSGDHVGWNWGLGNALSGSVGADYSRQIGGFFDTGTYSRDIVTTYDEYASMRFQAGPHWGIFGGLMDQNFSLSESAFNNSKIKAVDIGTDYTTNASNRFGFDYRYSDDRTPNTSRLNGVLFDPDYREDRARALFNYALSEKTTLDATVGYLRREYPSTAIGSFSGDIWRVKLQWQPTLKTQVAVGTWRQLNADLTAVTNYYLSRGVTIAPAWTASEKVTLTLTATQEYQDYIGSNPVGVLPLDSTAGRRDTLSLQTLNMAYTLSRAISFSVTAGHERRDSNFSQFEYNDFRADASIKYKFLRIGDPQ